MQSYESAKTDLVALQKEDAAMHKKIADAEKKVAAYEIVMPDFGDNTTINSLTNIKPLLSSDHREIPIVDQIFVFAHHHVGYEFAVKDLTQWLVDWEIYSDLGTAQSGVNAQLYQRANIFKHVKRGIYALTDEGQHRARVIMSSSRNY